MSRTSKTQVSDYLRSRKQCDGHCSYKEFCPEYPPAIEVKKGSGCIILGLGKLDVFYNLFFGGAEGIKTELQRTLYALESEDDPQSYLQACTKTMTTVYGTDNKADQIPPTVKINIVEAHPKDNKK